MKTDPRIMREAQFAAEATVPDDGDYESEAERQRLWFIARDAAVYALQNRPTPWWRRLAAWLDKLFAPQPCPACGKPLGTNARACPVCIEAYWARPS